MLLGFSSRGETCKEYSWRSKVHRDKVSSVRILMACRGRGCLGIGLAQLGARRRIGRGV